MSLICSVFTRIIMIILNITSYDLNTHTHTHTHTHTCWLLWLMETLHRRNGFYTLQTVFSIALQQPYT